MKESLPDQAHKTKRSKKRCSRKWKRSRGGREGVKEEEEGKDEEQAVEEEQRRKNYCLCPVYEDIVTEDSESFQTGRWCKHFIGKAACIYEITDALLHEIFFCDKSNVKIV